MIQVEVDVCLVEHCGYQEGEFKYTGTLFLIAHIYTFPLVPRISTVARRYWLTTKESLYKSLQIGVLTSDLQKTVVTFTDLPGRNYSGQNGDNLVHHTCFESDKFKVIVFDLTSVARRRD